MLIEESPPGLLLFLFLIAVSVIIIFNAFAVENTQIPNESEESPVSIHTADLLGSPAVSAGYFLCPCWCD